MISNALKGYNVSVLAYGQTNSGKTFTIRGGDQSPGIIPLTAAELFKKIEFLQSPEGIEMSLKEKADSSFQSQSKAMNDQIGNTVHEVSEIASFGNSRPPSGNTTNGSMIQRKINISVSYLEIYNESVNDLLDKDKRNLDVRDHRGETFVEGLTCKRVQSTEEVKKLIELGEEVRIIAETRVNSKSTRSHTVFRINVEIDDRNTQTGRHAIRSS